MWKNTKEEIVLLKRNEEKKNDCKFKSKWELVIASTKFNGFKIY